ncbi:hypothetical protein BASA60_003053 [Batrachochytrium salamandrivorans]|nr:hypothetical protein BASA60_003053 [Batrachochytrium salamandrivorans]
MGNALAGQFDVQQQIGYADKERLWVVKAAVSKGNGKPCAVWIFDKNDSERRNSLTRKSHLKNELAIISDLLKREVQFLTKLRHPSIVQVQESLQEIRTLYAFATEPLMDTLSNVLSGFKPIRQGEQMSLQSDYELDSLEIQKGLRQVANGLQFLHSANIIHINLCPEAIMINPKGDWKLSGLKFAVSVAQGDALSYAIPVDAMSNPAQQPNCCTPDLAFVAPEVILDGQCSKASDVWSFGVLIHALFNNGRPLFECNGNQYTYRERVNGMLMVSVIQLRNVPAEIEGIAASMLPMNPQSRISLEQFQSSCYFDNVLMTTLEYIELLIQKPNLEKAKFLKALPALLSRFPEKIVYRKIFPLLLDELKSTGIAPFALPSIFWILERIPNDGLVVALGALRPLFYIIDPPQCGLLLLSKIDLLTTKFTSNIMSDILPFVMRSMDSQHLPILDAAIKSISHMLAKVDLNSVRNVVFKSTHIVTTKINCLMSLYAIVKVLDKIDVIDRVLPMLERNQTDEISVAMAMLAVYEGVSAKIDVRSIALSVIPSLWRNSTQRGLNRQQFMRFMSLIDTLSVRVKDEMLRNIASDAIPAPTSKLDMIIQQENDPSRSIDSDRVVSSGMEMRSSESPNRQRALSGNTAIQPKRGVTPPNTGSTFSQKGWMTQGWDTLPSQPLTQSSQPTPSPQWSNTYTISPPPAPSAILFSGADYNRTMNPASSTRSTTTPSTNTSQKRIVSEFDPLGGK